MLVLQIQMIMGGKTFMGFFCVLKVMSKCLTFAISVQISFLYVNLKGIR